MWVRLRGMPLGGVALAQEQKATWCRLPKERHYLLQMSQGGHQRDIYLLTFENAPTPPPDIRSD